MATLALAVAVFVAVVTIVSSTDRLIATPRLYGWNRDADIDTLYLPGTADHVLAGLADNPGVNRVQAGDFVLVDIEGVRVGAVGLDNVRGSISPAVAEGRAPRDGEIVLGRKTMRQTGSTIGDTIIVRIGDHTGRLRVVGRGLFGNDGDFLGKADEGAYFTFATLRRLKPDATIGLVRFDVAPKADADAVVSQVRNAVSPMPVYTARPPGAVTSFGRARQLPAVVAGIMTAIAAIALAHTMMNSLRSRRRDIAVLTTLGCVRSQTSMVVLGQGGTFAVIASAIGIPAGLLGGHLIWDRIADTFGVASRPTTDPLVVLLVVPSLLILTGLVALVPAWMARRVDPAVVLRSD